MAGLEPLTPSLASSHAQLTLERYTASLHWCDPRRLLSPSEVHRADAAVLRVCVGALASAGASGCCASRTTWARAH
jgi:hypothetical protein